MLSINEPRISLQTKWMVKLILSFCENHFTIDKKERLKNMNLKKDVIALKEQQ